jgi:diguanylate cyclase (GGDEF)-like protein
MTETTLREVRYRSLPAGSYVFEVSCGSAALGWSNPTQYAFSIQAPWWGTWRFRLGATGLVIFLLWALVRHRMRRITRERERLEVAVAERSVELATANRALQEISLRDHLTGVRNRRFFESMISADASQALRAHNSDPKNFSRDHRDLIFYLIDIDHFKEVNDRYGHGAGDLLLVEFARRLGRVVRDSDFLVRWGGEEFLVVCRSAEQENGHVTAERLLKAIGSAPFNLSGGIALSKTCSVGWAPFPWSSSQNAILSIEEVLRLVDHGLYLAKDRGRNQATGILPKSAMPNPERPYTKLEDLLRDSWIRETRTSGPQPGGSSEDLTRSKTAPDAAPGVKV